MPLKIQNLLIASCVREIGAKGNRSYVQILREFLINKRFNDLTEKQQNTISKFGSKANKITYDPVESEQELVRLRNKLESENPQVSSLKESWEFLINNEIMHYNVQAMSFKILLSKAAQCVYSRYQEMPTETANLCLEENFSENDFNKCLTMFANVKKEDNVPAMHIDGNDIGYFDYHLTKLSPLDPSNLFLGVPTGCCVVAAKSHLGKHHIRRAIESPNAGFYVLSKKPKNGEFLKNNFININEVIAFAPIVISKDQSSILFIFVIAGIRQNEEMVKSFFNEAAEKLFQSASIDGTNKVKAIIIGHEFRTIEMRQEIRNNLLQLDAKKWYKIGNNEGFKIEKPYLLMGTYNRVMASPTSKISERMCDDEIVLLREDRASKIPEKDTHASENSHRGNRLIVARNSSYEKDKLLGDNIRLFSSVHSMSSEIDKKILRRLSL